MRFSIFASAAAVLGALAPGGAFAQQQADRAEGANAKDIIVTASRRAQALGETTRSVEVIDQAEITDQLTRSANIGDLLGAEIASFSAPNFNEINRAQTLRGRVPKFLIDGVPLDFNGFISFGESPLTKFDSVVLGRVEVLPGPTAIYGAGASGGLIQFFTRDAGDEPFAAELRHQLTFYPGADDPLGEDSLSWRSTALAHGTLGRFDYLAAVSYEAQNGIFDGEGELVNPVFYGFANRTNYFAKLGFDLDAAQRLEGFVNYSDTEADGRIFATQFRGIYAGGALSPSQTPFRYGADNTPLNQKQHASLTYTHDDLFSGVLTAQAFDRRDEIIGEFLDLRINAASPFWPSTFPNNYQKTQIDESQGLRLQYARSFWDRLDLVSGVDFERQERVSDGLVFALPADFDDVRDVSTPSRTALFNYPFELETLGVFVQADLAVAPRLRLSGGVRHEDASFVIGGGVALFDVVQADRPGGSGEESGQAYNIGAVFDIADAVSVFGSFAQGFEIPNLNQVSNLVPVDAPLRSSAAVEPQITDNYEIGMRGRFGDVDYALAIYRSESEFGQTFIYNAATGFGEFTRAPRRITGLDATLDWAATDRFTLQSSFGWADGEFDPDGAGPRGFVAISSLDVQPWKAVVQADFQATGDLRFNAQLLAVGDRDQAFEDRIDAFKIDGYVVADAGLSYQIGAGELGLQVTNLFDRQYLPPASQTYRGNANFRPRVTAAPGRAVSLAYVHRF